MIDSFPYDSWFLEDGVTLNPDISTFWTFGPAAGHDLTGTYVLTGLGMLAMVLAFIGWFVVEHRKLTHQAERLRAAGVLPEPEPGAHPERRPAGPQD